MFLESVGIDTFSVADQALTEAEQVSTPLSGPTLAAYRDVLGTRTEREQLWNTLCISMLAAGFAVLLGSGTAWLCHRTDVPFARWLGPMAILPLLFPPTITTLAFHDWFGARGLLAISFVLAVNFAPFTAALTSRGLRQVDGRLYEASLLARGRGRAELTLLRQVTPDVLVGALLVLVYVMSERGVPYVLSAKGKDAEWIVYSEAAFMKWSVPGVPASLKSAQATAFTLPLLVLSFVFVWLCLRARRRGSLVTLTSDFQPLPARRLGAWRWPGLGFAFALPVLGVVLPALTMALWTAGSTGTDPLSFETVRGSFRTVFQDWRTELLDTNLWSAVIGLVLLCLALPLAWHAARHKRAWIETLSMITLAVPAILLGVGYVRLWNRPGSFLGHLYDSPVALVCAYVTRLLPLGVLPLANAFRRLPHEFHETAQLCGRSAPSRFAHIALPLVLPAVFSVWILVFILSIRELDLAVLLLAGNTMAIRRVTDAVHFGYEDSAGAVVLILLACVATPIMLRTLVAGRPGEATT